jgi:hypothetical protein
MRIAIVIPTTRAPTLVERISRRTKLPRSLVLTRGDYRPVQGMSERYHHFVDAAGPLSDILTEQDVRYELCLGEAPETGRSWELPVALAHYVMQGGHEIVTENPELVVWATGAIGSDRTILEDDYHLETKREASRAFIDDLCGPGTAVLTLLPHIANAKAGNHDEEGCVGVTSLTAAIAALDTAIREKYPAEPCAVSMTTARASPRQSASGNAARRGGTARGVGLLVLVLMVGGGSYWFWSAEQSMGGDAAIPEALAVKGPADNADDNGEKFPAPTAAMTPQPLLRIIAHRAPEGASCIDVLFGGIETQAQVLSAQDNVFPVIETDGLCALGFRVEGEAGGRKLIIGDDVLSVILPSDRRNEFTLDTDAPTLLNLVARIPGPVSYRIIVRSEDGRETVFQHRLSSATEQATTR